MQGEFQKCCSLILQTKVPDYHVEYSSSRIMSETPLEGDALFILYCMVWPNLILVRYLCSSDFFYRKTLNFKLGFALNALLHFRRPAFLCLCYFAQALPLSGQFRNATQLVSPEIPNTHFDGCTCNRGHGWGK